MEQYSVTLNKTFDQKELSMDYINLRIKSEICYKTLQELSDENLMCIYKECDSVKKQIINIENILTKYVDEKIKQQIIQEYLINIIPPGTKGVIRGNRFNKIVENFINNLQLDKNKFDICFEKKYIDDITSEIPDWFIVDKITKKIIIGMNQVDLWGGGSQLNRGEKYIINNKYNNENSKLLCVISNDKELKSKKTKVFNLFNIGFQNDTLCYLNNLQNIIYSYFNLK